MSRITPALIVDYLSTLRRTPHEELTVVAAEGQAHGLPIVDAQTGALLHLLTNVSGARRVLEIGTAIGYSSLWIATALPADGMLITFEREEGRASKAREHFRSAGVAERVSVIAGDASRYLHKVAGPFDLIFQDGDKAEYEPMLPRLLDLLRPGGVLVTDNILWSGEVVPRFVDHRERDAADATAIAAYNRRLAADDRSYTAFLQIGDGVAVTTKLRGA